MAGEKVVDLILSAQFMASLFGLELAKTAPTPCRVDADGMIHVSVLAKVPGNVAEVEGVMAQTIVPAGYQPRKAGGLLPPMIRGIR